MLHSTMMEKRHVQRSAALLKQLALDFMIHAPLPDNHFFKWHRSGGQNTDFCKRLEIYSGYHQPLPENLATVGTATQLLVVCPHDDNGQVHRSLQTELPDLTVIRTTSPLDHRSIWYEIFPPGISKASAAAWVCEHHRIDRHTVLTVGNDYNDLDLLHWGNFSRVVANAPPDLRRQFAMVADHNNGGFAEAVADWRKIISASILESLTRANCPRQIIFLPGFWAEKKIDRLLSARSTDLHAKTGFRRPGVVPGPCHERS